MLVGESGTLRAGSGGKFSPLSGRSKVGGPERKFGYLGGGAKVNTGSNQNLYMRGGGFNIFLLGEKF